MTAASASNNRRPRLERVAFHTSRLAEFCGIKELTAQFGREPESWPAIILKELLDNGLDNCEDHGIAPEISIDVSTALGQISITDNGSGIPSDTLTGVLDYTVRVSSREAYVSPTRGQQGNALKCIFAAAFALDRTRGVTLVEARGQAFRIVFEMDPVRREPRILPWEITPSDVQNGTRITIVWPDRHRHRRADGQAP
jgi:DNA topoisomerase VI subunit B